MRRYTPPTCTLEVMAENSSLSRWAEQPVVKDVRFHLKLDDQTLAQDRREELHGDRAQLEHLRHTDNTYVQAFLEQSQDFLLQSVDLVDSGNPQAAVTASTETSGQSFPSDRDRNLGEIGLQPNGLLGHDLSLGVLATVESGSVIRLNTLQLFDLATALDDYSADLLELPTLPKTGWLRGRDNLAQIAAIAVAVVGLSASALKLLDSSMAPPAIAPTLSQGTSSNDQRIATQISPSVLDKATPPVISAEKLPSIPPIGSTPKIGIPTLVAPKPGELANPTLPSSKTLPQNSIATVPITGIPGRPTIISGEANSPAKSNKIASSSASGERAGLANGQAAAAPVAPIGRSPASRSALRGGDRAANATAFDTIPQVAEVRTYFQQRWKPPEGLTQTLEYSLTLAPNGSIQNITPLRQLSGDYIDRTGMPLVGDPFVSALSNERNAKIRLVLTTDGKVQAFLEPN
ncbi:MAG: DUF4335 domain-containing protein [Leptolyngbyaceae cyanobacterium CAN_BIN12]|nr:DUF4335 domain-containing protein [Leptolyngbyaceae cyanobacterium CAN_BIN12]